MKIRGTDFVRVPVSDLDTAARFYREVLGLTEEMLNHEYQWAEFSAGNVTLALHGGQSPPPPGTGACVALAVENLPAAYAELTAAGVRLGGPPQDWGVCQSLEVFDPDGNTLLLHHRTDGSFGPNTGP